MPREDSGYTHTHAPELGGAEDLDGIANAAGEHGLWTRCEEAAEDRGAREERTGSGSSEADEFTQLTQREELAVRMRARLEKMELANERLDDLPLQLVEQVLGEGKAPARGSGPEEICQGVSKGIRTPTHLHPSGVRDAPSGSV